MNGAGESFRKFFGELNGRPPFPWQERLAERVCGEAGWPQVIRLPTGSGKTACLDIAVFALAHCGKQAARRVFYIVDRRLVVNEALQRMQRMAARLQQARTGELGWVRGRLLELAGAVGEEADGEAEPLRVFEARGGTYRDDAWVENPLQPTVIASTVDQIGSQLLFSGYGLSDGRAPIHAALIARDSLLLLDEAHASRAFGETLAAVEQYAKLNEGAGIHAAPLRFVEMTATPSRSAPPGGTFALDAADLADGELRRRLLAAKPTRLDKVSVRRDDFGKLAELLINKAKQQAAAAVPARRVAILCNRVRTARLAYDRLRKDGLDAVLVTGRMRPLDRDDLYRERLLALKSGEKRDAAGGVVYVVATQSLEVGADLDFDVMVSEVASLDALQQRFGRLNRMGEIVTARGSILAGAWHLETKRPDPVYGETMPATWAWLQAQAVEDEVAMGLQAPEGGKATVPMLASGLAEEEWSKLVLLGPPAPVLLPAHLDAWSQTSPRPEPLPEIAFFLHGAKPVAAEVQVVWRADLSSAQEDDWPEIVGLCPPVAAEAMPVALRTMERWLRNQEFEETADADREGVLEVEEPEADGVAATARRGMIWRGNETRALKPGSLRPGDTVILPVPGDGKGVPTGFGHKPDGAAFDLADRARWCLRGRVTLRLRREVIEAAGWPDDALRTGVLAALGDEDEGEALDQIRARLDEGALPKGWLGELADALRGGEFRRPRWSRYPQGRGWILQARYRRHVPAGGEVTLEEHLGDVARCARALAGGGLEERLAGAVEAAAERHDWGKADPRFQARLRGGDGWAGRFAPELLAKSARGWGGGADRSGLPTGWRHEMLSFLMAERELAGDQEERDLILHLVASHHGYCRPFAPVVRDPGPRAVRWNGAGLDAAAIAERPAHSLEHGVADRFWRLSRRFGWWGLAYLEAMLRLADWEASTMRAAEVGDE